VRPVLQRLRPRRRRFRIGRWLTKDTGAQGNDGRLGNYSCHQAIEVGAAAVAPAIAIVGRPIALS
jgi:hypothetical protein